MWTTCRGLTLLFHPRSAEQKELENFPVGSIQSCQALMNACSYDSILALVCKEAGQAKADLHLFQCDHIKVCVCVCVFLHAIPLSLVL